MFLSIRWRKAKTASLTLLLTFYSGGKEKKGKYLGKENIFFSGRKENHRRKRRKIFGEDLWRILRSFGFGLQTFPNFLEGFDIGFREFGLGEKSPFWFWRIWSRKKISVSVSENLVSEKKSWFRFQRIWSRKKSLGFREFGFGFGQNFGIVIQWTALRSLYLFVINIVKKGHPARRPDEHGRNLVDWEGDGVQADRARGGKDEMIIKAEQAITFHTSIFLISCSKSARNSVLWC